MIPAKFDYRRAGSVGEAISLLSEQGDGAKLLAGGHSLLPLMKLRLAVPTMLVDIGRLSDLSYVHDQGDHLAIGALTRHRDLEQSEVLRAQAPVLAYVAGQVGDPQVRHRGTIGGSIAHGDPASDLPAVVLALDGTMVVEGPRGRREVPAAEFFLSFLETAIRPDEVLVEIRVPKVPGGWAFEKFHRRAQDWATVGVVAVAGDALAGDAIAGGDRGPVRVSLVNMGLTPIRAQAVEEAVAAGEGPAEAAERATEGTEPANDLNASAEFRRHLATVLVRRALERALAGAQAPA
jgi:aerobic carbon-monoxide dehydrogenase medium subunit